MPHESKSPRRDPWTPESVRGYTDAAIQGARSRNQEVLREFADWLERRGLCPGSITLRIASARVFVDRVTLGHADLSTTHGYVEITLRMKQAAVAAASALPDLAGGAFPTRDLLTWLANLGRSNYVQQPLPGRHQSDSSRPADCA